VKYGQKLNELERRAGAEANVIGTCWPDKPDEIKTGRELLTWRQWDKRYPDAGHVKLTWGDK